MPSIIDDMYKEPKKTSVYFWLALWAITLIHAGLMAGAMLSNIKFPPGYEIPPNWINLLGQGANPGSFWFYIGILGVNILWESPYKGPKTYVPSSFPFPTFFCSYVAMGLWMVINLFAHLGLRTGWFPYPAQLSHTFWCSIGLAFVQFEYMSYLNDPVEFMKEFQNKPKPAKAETPQLSDTVPASNSNIGVNNPNQTVSTNADITEKVLDYVRQNGQVKSSGLIGVLGSPKRTVIRNLNKLLEEGKLIREGNGRNAVYRLNGSPKDGKWN
jgi:hypothetical protein